MSLNTLVDYISNSQITSELIKRISKNNELNIVGSSRYAKSIILYSIAKKEKKNILLICPKVEIAYKWIGYFESINDKAVLYYPPTEHLPYSSINKSKEIEFSQLTVLFKLIKKEKNELNIVISTERSLQPHLINKKLFNLSFISKSNPACIISILLILSNVFCEWGSYSLIFSITLSKNSNLIGNSLLTG